MHVCIYNMICKNNYVVSVKKCLQGLNIAKMYYEAGEMEESLK